MTETEALLPSERNQRRASLFERTLDQGLGYCPLKIEEQGRIMREHLQAHHAELYDLHAWVVMPNHVHALLTPLEDVKLATIMKRLKGATSRFINQARGVSGTLWQGEYFDRYMRNEEHMEKVAHYIHWNPVKAGLCTAPGDWALSSASAGKVRVVRERRAQYGDEFDPFCD